MRYVVVGIQEVTPQNEGEAAFEVFAMDGASDKPLADMGISGTHQPKARALAAVLNAPKLAGYKVVGVGADFVVLENTEVTVRQYATEQTSRQRVAAFEPSNQERDHGESLRGDTDSGITPSER